MTDIQIWQPQPAELAVYDPAGPLDDWIRVVDQVVRLSEVICRTPFVPDGLRGNPAATAAAILTGRELQVPPMTALANIHVIHNKPGLSALLMRALVLSKGHEWMDVEVNNTRVIVKGRRRGEVEWTEASFTTADAQTAKLPLGGYPQDKLYARASARLARRKFADVIAGMPYSIEELEDGVTPDEDGTTVATAPETPAAAAPAPRTAQRRTRTPAQPATPAAVTTVPAASAGAGLPPLPGEEDGVPTSGGEATSATAPPNGDASSSTSGTPDDTDYDTPGTVATPQITAIWTVLSVHYQFGKDERDQARMVCAQIIGRDLESTKNLSRNEAKGILDTLGHWRSQAEAKGEDTRAYLIQMLAAAEEARHGGE